MSGLGVFMVRTRWSTFCMETVNKRKKGGLALFKVKKKVGAKAEYFEPFTYLPKLRWKDNYQCCVYALHVKLKLGCIIIILELLLEMHAEARKRWLFLGLENVNGGKHLVCSCPVVTALAYQHLWSSLINTLCLICCIQSVKTKSCGFKMPPSVHCRQALALQCF